MDFFQVLFSRIARPSSYSLSVSFWSPYPIDTGLPNGRIRFCYCMERWTGENPMASKFSYDEKRTTWYFYRKDTINTNNTKKKVFYFPYPTYPMSIAFILLVFLGSTQKIAPYANTFLDSYGKHIRIFLLIIAFSLPGLLFAPDLISSRETGGWALELLWIILFIPILAKVLHRSLAKKLIPWRKELGILMGMTALVHSLQYFSVGGIMHNVTDGTFWAESLSIPFFTVGLIALLLSTILLITSNLSSQIKLKKNWKLLHRLAYPLLVLVIIHVILIKWSRTGQISWEEFGPLVIYGCLKIAEWRGISFFVPVKIQK